MSGYVVCGHEHLQDGHEYWAKAFVIIEDALRYINEVLSRVPAGNRHNFDLRLFKLGKEIPLDVTTTSVQGPPVETTVAAVRKAGGRKGGGT